MNIKTLTNAIYRFSLNKIIEIIGLSIMILGILLLVALLSYSPEDPNFIFPEKSKIKNLLNFQGSFTSDLFFQSIGLISLLIPFSLIFCGINILLSKKLFFIISTLFYSIIYTLFGSIFFNHYYPNAFELYMNGNGGFVENILIKPF